MTARGAHPAPGRTPVKGATRLVSVATVLLLLGEQASAQGSYVSIGADPSYAPSLDDPTYPETSGPVVAVYGASTAYTIADRFLGFARLLSADGYVVESFDEPFAPGC